MRSSAAVALSVLVIIAAAGIGVFAQQDRPGLLAAWVGAVFLLSVVTGVALRSSRRL